MLAYVYDLALNSGFGSPVSFSDCLYWSFIEIVSIFILCHPLLLSMECSPASAWFDRCTRYIVNHKGQMYIQLLE